MRRVFNYSRDQFKVSSGVEFKVDTKNKEVVTVLSKYFTGCPEFEKTKGHSFKKGLLLFGQVGTGKTTIMRLFKDTPLAYIKLISCRSVADEYTLYGLEQLQNYYVNPYLSASNFSRFGHRNYSYCFDDLGTETIASHFGETRNVMADVILNRYDNSLPFYSTFIS